MKRHALWLFLTTLSFLLLILSACSPEDTEPDLPNSDVCLLKSSDHVPTLSTILDSLNPHRDSLKQTGVYVFEEGEEAIITRAWLSQQAQQTIDIQYFIFSEDNIGVIACDYMLEAACRGVKIRLIVDDLLVDVHPEHVLALDEHENIDIKIYNPNLNIGKSLAKKVSKVVTDFRGINQRMHHKTFIVDNQVVITGGRNIADEYFDYDHEYNFRDRDVLLIGDISEGVQVAFNDYWDSELTIDIEDLIDYPKEDYNYNAVHQWVHRYAQDTLNYWPQIRETVPYVFDHIQSTNRLYWVDSVAFVSDMPGKNDGSQGLKGGSVTTDELVSLVNHAEESIYIQTPYLIMTDLGMNLFRDAINRGVDVYILTNSLSSTDNLEAFSGYRRNRHKLLETGIKIYEYKPDAEIRKQLIKSELQKRLDYVPIFGLHAKSMVIDDDIAVIGTFNLDPRSANLNTECITVIHSTEVARDMAVIMKEELNAQNAWHTTTDYNPDSEASIGKRIKVSMRRVVPKSIL